MWSIKKGIKQMLGQPEQGVSLQASVDKFPQIGDQQESLLVGWALDVEHKPVRLELQFDGVPIAEYRCQIPRNDVHAVYPNNPYSLTAGFSIPFHLHLLARVEGGRLRLVGHFSAGVQVLWTWEGVPEIAKGGAQAYESLFPEEYKQLLEALEAAGQDLPIPGETFPWASGSEFSYLAKSKFPNELTHYFIEPGSIDDCSLHLFLPVTSSLPTFERSLRSLAREISVSTSFVSTLSLIVPEDFDCRDTFETLVRDVIGSSVQLNCFTQAEAPQWSAISRTAGKRDLVLYLSDRFSYSYVDLKDFTEQLLARPAVQVLMPTPYGAQSNICPPPGAHLSDLRAHNGLLPELSSTKCLAPCWMSDLDFLCEIEARVMSQPSSATGNPQLLPPSGDTLVYHFDLKQALVPLCPYEIRLNYLDSFFASQCLRERFSLSKTNEDIVVILVPELEGGEVNEQYRENRFLRIETELEWTRGLGYQILEFAERLRESGKRVVFVEDTDREPAPFLYGSFSSIRLKDFALPHEFSGKGWIVSTCLETVSAAYTLKYTTGLEVIDLLQSQAQQRAGRSPELLDKARWASKALAYSLSFEERAAKGRDGFGVTQIPFAFDSSVFCERSLPRKSKSILVIPPSEGEPLSQVQELCECIQKLKATDPSIHVSLVNYRLRRKSHQLLRGIADSVYSPTSQTEMASHFSETEIVLDVFPSSSLNILPIEASACGAFVLTAEHAGFVPLDSGIVQVASIGEISNELKNALADKKSVSTRIKGTQNWIAKLPKKPSILSQIEEGFQLATTSYNKLTDDLKETKPCSLVMPVYGALDCVQPALRTLVRNLSEVSEVIIVNDHSDQRVSDYLDAFSEQHQQVRVIHRSENGGFIEACYTGLEAANPAHDIILMNSDVVLTEGSVKRLRLGAYSSSRIALASPLSTGSVHLQIDLNEGDSLEEAAQKIRSHSNPQYPTIMTAEGQLLYIKRWAIERFGFFDRVYGRGFCEESDMCMRMFLHGADMVCVDNVLIGHKRSASFSARVRSELYRQNRPVFDARWGRYYLKAYRTFRAGPMVSHVQMAYRALGQSVPKPEGPFILDERVEHFGQYADRSLGSQVSASVGVLKDAEVVFILPSIILGGGTLSVLQHVNELVLRGIKARIVTLKDPQLGDYPLLTQPIVVAQDHLSSLDWTNQKVVATYWFTSYLVKNLVQRYPNLDGFYYIQDYEAWFYSRPENFHTVQRAEKSYELGLKCIAKTEFLRDLIKKEHGVDVEVITPGLNRSVFYPGNQDKYFGRTRITALYRTRTPRRGYQDLQKMAAELLQRMPEASLSFFGDVEKLPEGLEGRVEVLGSLPQDKVGSHYRDNDILIDMSHWHGFGRMGIESMACGAVPVLSRSGGVDRYAVDGENALLFDVGDYSTAADCIVRLACDRDLRMKLRQAGLESLDGFSERNASSDWIRILGLSPQYSADEIPEVPFHNRLREEATSLGGKTVDLEEARNLRVNS